MQVHKKIMILLISLLLIFLPLGCLNSQERSGVNHPTGSPDRLSKDINVAERFQESTPQAPTAVDSAIELSQKYAELSEEASVLRQENQNLTTKNKQLEDQVATLDTQLQQTQKELTEANDLLLEMRVELNNWKTDILGFRNEMREAGKTQLEALLKILKVLGGEVTAEPTPMIEDTSTIPVSPNETDRTEQQKIEIVGEPNE